MSALHRIILAACAGVLGMLATEAAAERCGGPPPLRTHLKAERVVEAEILVHLMGHLPYLILLRPVDGSGTILASWPEYYMQPEFNQKGVLLVGLVAQTYDGPPWARKRLLHGFETHTIVNRCGLRPFAIPSTRWRRSVLQTIGLEIER